MYKPAMDLNPWLAKYPYYDVVSVYYLLIYKTHPLKSEVPVYREGKISEADLGDGPRGFEVS